MKLCHRILATQVWYGVQAQRNKYNPLRRTRHAQRLQKPHCGQLKQTPDGHNDQHDLEMCPRSEWHHTIILKVSVFEPLKLDQFVDRRAKVRGCETYRCHKIPVITTKQSALAFTTPLHLSELFRTTTITQSGGLEVIQASVKTAQRTGIKSR